MGFMDNVKSGIKKVSKSVEKHKANQMVRDKNKLANMKHKTAMAKAELELETVKAKSRKLKEGAKSRKQLRMGMY